jgi:hypothetical protein
MKHSEVGFRLVKIADIGYITILYAISALLFAKVFDKLMKLFDTEDDAQKSSLRLFIEIIVYLWIAGIIMYLVRNIMGIIPSPFEGLYGFEHLRVKELDRGGVFIFIFLYFGEALKKKLTLLYDRLLF